ncbi:hypothetical protein B0H12DRAFT_1177944 [Mycena haematopus]|nr:hypothetical protein B0H12DRAFT_1177944 [Mycena haematopus]
MAGGPTTTVSNSGLIATPPTTAATVEGRLADLRQSIQNALPGTAGIHPVRAEDLVVYYDVDPSSSSRIDLGNASGEDLSALLNAYRNTGTMDSTQFAARLDVVASGLIDGISNDVLQGENVDKLLRAQLSHMKVYGCGDCDEPQQNTPSRNSNLIGSLVVIFPSPHVGGRLTIPHENTTLFYDPSVALSTVATPAVSYIALYGDVSSTMAPIDSGHRVELVYDLFVADRRGDSSTTPGESSLTGSTPTATESLLEDGIRALLTDPGFLPNGGFLAVGLAHKYPMPPPVAYDFDPDVQNVYTSKTPATRWGHFLESLKGIDARMRAVYWRIGLTPSVKLVYSNRHDDVLLDEIANLSGIHEGVYCFGEPDYATDVIREDGIVLRRDSWRIDEFNRQLRTTYRHLQYTWRSKKTEGMEGLVEGPVVHWLTDLGEHNRVHSPYPGEDHMCADQPGTAALLIPVPAFGNGIRTITV